MTPARIRTAALIGSVAISALVISLAGCASSVRAADGSTASASSAETSETGRVTTIEASSQTCGRGWNDPQPGQQTFLVKDTDNVSGEVYLTQAQTGRVFAYLDNLNPSGSANMSVNLGSGSYTFRCAMSDDPVALGPTVVVPGTVKSPVAPVQPIRAQDLIPPTLKYQNYVSAALPTLAAQVGQLRKDIAANNLTKAKVDWLAAHLTYERLGAAYDAFGALDAAINGTAAGLPGGVKDKNFTGFHRIEYGLWHGQKAAQLTPYATALVNDVAKLRTQFQTTEINPLQVSLRAHEIVENALQFELTGETDYGSRTNLATVAANLVGTQEVLNLLRGLMAPRYPAWSQTTTLLMNTQHVLARYDVRGRWAPLASLTQRQRETLNSDVSELTELLAPIAEIGEPRLTS